MAARLIAVSLLWLATLGASSAIAFAQSGENPGAADSGSSDATVRYESAFSDYKPFREQALRSWKEANQEVADNPMGHGAGAMKGSPGKAGAAGHDMSAMKGTPGKGQRPGHDMGAMKGTPGKASAPAHDMGAMKEPSRKANLAIVDPKAAPGRTAPPQVTGTGIVQTIDKANGRIKLTHDPIAALGWPKLSLFFRLKDRALAEQVKEGERVQFSLENSASGFVISEFHAAPAKPSAK